jgi:chaperonin GroEL (HSP60 family)
MIYTSFKNQETLRLELARANDKLLKILNNVSSVLGKELHPIKKDSYHFLADMLFPETRSEKTLYATIASSMQKSELTSAKSSYMVMLFSVFYLKELLKHADLLNENETLLNDKFDIAFAKFKSAITKHSKIITEERLYKEIHSVCEDETLSTTLVEAMRLSGLEGKIAVEDSHQSNYMIEMRNGYSFKLNPFKFFLNNDVWQESNVKVLVVDGMIESVSELNNILNKSMETKIPMVIIGHGFSEEVVATLKANKDHGVLNVMPVRMFPDVESLNVVNDIAVVCGSDIVSCVKGEQVQFVNYDLIPIVEKIRCTSKEFMIENGRTANNVASHIKTLLKKREENRAVEDLCNLIDGRIKSLFSHAVTIHLPNMTKTEKDAIRVKVDIVLRTSKTLLTYGYVNLSDVLTEVEATANSTLDKIFVTVLKNIKAQMESLEIPTLSLFLGTYLSMKSILMLLTSKGFIENDRF